MRIPRRHFMILFAVIGLAAVTEADEAPTSQQIDFFESKVRPLLVERCHNCHGPDEQEANLRLDSRALVLKGGDTGPAVVPGDADVSELVRAVRYDPDGYQMPPDGKLPDNEIETLVRWVEMGAPWPDDDRPVEGNSDTFDLTERARRWSFQPLARPAIPDDSNADWCRSPIDHFLLDKLNENGLTPAPAADAPTLLRRACFDVTGLPPSLEQVERFASDPSSEAYNRLIDELLASPHFGERWGRHWLDLVRYAESRGHEFDHNVANAFQYRDYIICALNDDVPYDQIVVEHVAGDLLRVQRDTEAAATFSTHLATLNPQHTTRLHPLTGANESIVATGFWFLGEWVHSPVDIRADEAERFANMIDVYSKTFLGLTVACARCHDHKFDPITTKDYYALQGYLQSAHYRQARFETMEHNRQISNKLAALRNNADRHVATPGDSTDAVATDAEPQGTDERSASRNQRLLEKGFYPATVEAIWSPDELIVEDVGFRRHRDIDERPHDAATELTAPREHVSDPSSFIETDPDWNALSTSPGTMSEPGATAGWDHTRVVRTPSFEIGSGHIYALVQGSVNTYVAVDSHLLIAGPLHGSLVKAHPAVANWHWIEHDVSRYTGHRAHLELLPNRGEPMAIADVVLSSSPPPMFVSSDLTIVDDAQPDSSIGRDLRPENPRDAQCDADLLRQIQPISALTPAMVDGTGEDEYVFIRGNWKKRGDTVPRRFLEVFHGDDMPRPDIGSGRLELAEWMVDPAKTPILPRVIVNRIWLHYFGQGIVPTPDDFGYMGQEPSHPELLDWLASELVDNDWSLKHIHRLILTSAAYQMASEIDGRMLMVDRQKLADDSIDPQPSTLNSNEVDPANRLLHRMNIKRLEGEAIRDAILSLSGRLDERQYGPSVPVHLTPFMEGRGLPAESGPVDGAGRRSIYLSVRRNFPEPFFQAFDMPNPHSTVGRRNVSNVPAQALAMMNNPLVVEQSRLWADRLLASPDLPTDDSRLSAAYLASIARPPTDEERTAAMTFLAAQSSDSGTTTSQAWQDLCHVLLNAKEFLFVR